MKRLSTALLIILAFAVFGCTTTNGSNGPTDESVAEPVVIIDHQNRGLGDVPPWVTMDQGQIEDLSQFKDYFVFKESLMGKDLNATKVWAKNFVIDDEISRLVSTRIQSKFAGAMVGTVDGADTYFEKIVKSVTEARVAGVRREAEYWILRRMKTAGGDTNDVYEYFILIKVPVAEVKKAVQRAFDANPPKSEEEIRARDHVKKAMDEDTDW